MPTISSDRSEAYESFDLSDPRVAESVAASDEAGMTRAQRGVRWMRAHRRPLGLVAFGVLTLAALANKRLRPLVLAKASASVRGALARVQPSRA
ncbi:MAG TPA: hypothetical protein VM261_12740 [Kofleriaceae bacterium]|nr:hypothetical protein [Kofleriaceae bacterium]